MIPCNHRDNVLRRNVYLETMHVYFSLESHWPEKKKETRIIHNIVKCLQHQTLNTCVIFLPYIYLPQTKLQCDNPCPARVCGYFMIESHYFKYILSINTICIG